MDQTGLYIMSVAADLMGLHPSTLRLWERKGLLTPSRTRRRNPALQRRQPRAHAPHLRAHRQSSEPRRHRTHPRTRRRARSPPQRAPSTARRSRQIRSSTGTCRPTTLRPNQLKTLPRLTREGHDPISALREVCSRRLSASTQDQCCSTGLTVRCLARKMRFTLEWANDEQRAPSGLEIHCLGFPAAKVFRGELATREGAFPEPPCLRRATAPSS